MKASFTRFPRVKRATSSELINLFLFSYFFPKSGKWLSIRGRIEEHCFENDMGESIVHQASLFDKETCSKFITFLVILCLLPKSRKWISIEDKIREHFFENHSGHSNQSPMLRNDFM